MHVLPLEPREQEIYKGGNDHGGAASDLMHALSLADHSLHARAIASQLALQYF